MREYSEMAKFSNEVRKLERERIDDYVKDKLLELSIDCIYCYSFGSSLLIFPY